MSSSRGEVGRESNRSGRRHRVLEDGLQSAGLYATFSRYVDELVLPAFAEAED